MFNSIVLLSLHLRSVGNFKNLFSIELLILVIRRTNFNGSFLCTKINIMIYLQHSKIWINAQKIDYIIHEETTTWG